MFDCASFLNRKGWKQKDLAEKLGSSVSKVGMWCTGKSFPYYSDIVKLVEFGMTLEELFGDELAGRLYESSKKADLSEVYNTPEFQKGVQDALIALASRRR